MPHDGHLCAIRYAHKQGKALFTKQGTGRNLVSPVFWLATKHMYSQDIWQMWDRCQKRMSRHLRA